MFKRVHNNQPADAGTQGSSIVHARRITRRTIPRVMTALVLTATILLASCSTAPDRTFTDTREAKTATHKPAAETWGKLPLSFEENRGQTDARVRYLARGPGYTLFLTADETVLSLREPAGSAATEATTPAQSATADPKPEPATLRLSLAGANKTPASSAEVPLAGRSNYFRGSNPEEWTTHVNRYAKVRYHDVYPGIDLVYYGNQRQLEYDFVVAPGVDPSVIRLEIAGADQARIDTNGDLVIDIAGRKVVQHKPVVYQHIAGERISVTGDYILAQGRLAQAGTGDPFQLSFALGDYDSTRTLVIDPILAYSTYVSGQGYDAVQALRVDSLGDVYFVGVTESPDFPEVGGLPPDQGGHDGLGTWDAFIAKLNADGNALVYSTYLSGNGHDQAMGLVVDDQGSVYVSGFTDSTDFPVVGGLPPDQAGTPDGQSSAFVAKLNPTGDALLYSTYVGAGGGFEETISFEEATSLAVDDDGNAYIAGLAVAPYEFPIVGGLPPEQGGAPDIDGSAMFVAKLDPAGAALVYSSYLSGTDGENSLISTLAVDDLGQLYLGGTTHSMDLPRVGGLPDDQGGAPYGGAAKAYFAKLNAEGNGLIYATYLSADTTTIGDALAIDAAGNLYVAGRTTSDNFPVVGGLSPEQGGQADLEVDMYIAKINPAGNALVYSTYLGGDSADEVRDIAVDDTGALYLAGGSSSTNLPQVRGLPPEHGGTPVVVDSILGPQPCAYSAKLNPAGDALDYATYLCANAKALAIAATDFGLVYVAGEVGNTEDVFFPIVGGLPPDQGGAQAGGIDAFVAMLVTNARLLSIERARYEVSATQNEIAIAVIRSGQLSSEVTVDYTTVNGTATGDFHYVPVGGTLSWPQDDGEPRIVTIPILPDGPAGDEDPYFFLELSNASSGMIGTPDIAQITIVQEPVQDLIFASGFE